MKKIFFLISALAVIRLANAQSFTNPVLAGYYPDPSICKAGNDYYLVNSSFAYYPGLPLFHSTNLIDWKQIGYAMDRPSQLDLTGAPVANGGLYAPTIRYHKGLFYIVCTQVGPKGNFVITAKDPKGPWSEPVYLPEVIGIDPSLFFDDNDSCWLVHNAPAPNNKPLYDGHCTIRLFAFDYKNLKVVGPSRIIVNGGVDITQKPKWIEGPHLYKKDGWYYLMCGEGGTEEGHSEVIFRAKNLTDSFLPYEKNPVLTQRHLLNTPRQNPITSTGHADIVQDNNGSWWGVFLGCRPYEGDYYNTGRETFMTPVEWKDGWPHFILGGDEVKYSYPINAKANRTGDKLNGNYFFKDEFDAAKLNVRYQFLRTVKQNWYNLTEKKGSLTIQLLPQTCSEKDNAAFIGFHQPHTNGYAATALNFTAKVANEKAGLMVYQNENAYYFFCKSVKDGKPVLELYKDASLLSSVPLPEENKKPLLLKIEAQGNRYNFYFSIEKNKWTLFKDNVDAVYVSTRKAGGFVGCLYTMYTTSKGKPSSNKAIYNWFEVKNDDDVYKK
ncbi:MAG: glycoside hydrolase family 43 protein [Ferruginibacter sp.]